MNKSSRILFLGDCFFGGVLEFGDYQVNIPKTPNGIVVANVEQSITSEHIVDKCTVLSSKNALENGIKEIGVTHAGLANNHIHDGGLDSIKEVVDLLDEAGVKAFGAGNDIRQASEPIKLNEDLYLIGCCTAGTPTLNDVAVATHNTAGLMDADYELILGQIQNQPGKEFVIYIHWGAEHISLPDPYVRDLAKRLLTINQIKAVIGMHPHIILPVEKFNGKPVYYSLGNFLFPNFIIAPPTKLSFDRDYAKETYSYHEVKEPTLKKWPLINRLSLVLDFDQISGRFTEVVFLQSKDSRCVKPAPILLSLLVKAKFKCQSALLKLVSNNRVYKLIYRTLYYSVIFKRWSYISLKLFNQFGILHVWKILKKLML